MRFATAAIATALAASLVSPSSLLADDPPAAPPPAAPAEEDPPFFDIEKVDCQTPPCRVERPAPRWLFVNLDAMKETARSRGQSMDAFVTLKARLYLGRIRANIFVHAYPDPVSRREPLPAVDRGREALEAVRGRLIEARVEQQGAITVAGKEGYSFELRAKKAPGSTDEITLVRTVVYRQSDNQVFVITMECPADQAADLKRDYAKLLRKIRL